MLITQGQGDKMNEHLNPVFKEILDKHYPKPKQDYWADYKAWLKRLKDGDKEIER